MFNHPAYEYWQDRIDYIYQIKGLNLDSRLIGLFDNRTIILYQVITYLNAHPNKSIEIDIFDYLPASYEDLLVIAYLINELDNPDNVAVSDRQIKLIR